MDSKQERLQQITIQTILSICNAMEAKDTATREHSVRVAEYSVMIAKKAGWNAEQIEELKNIALLHDIGKIGVRDAVLNKEGSLTEEEYEEMKRHTDIGSQILKDLTFLPGLNKGVRFHHERYDGKGYPLGLIGEKIPIEGRIIGIADAVDVMNSSRAYKEQYDSSYIIKELENGKGTQFDPVLAQYMMELIEEGSIQVRNAEADRKIVFLIGYRGTGKSTIAAYCARNNDIKCIDLDKQIEVRMEMSIVEAFATRGEEYFRQQETDTLFEICQMIQRDSYHYIIACGGGVVLKNRNIEIMNKYGSIVRLDASAETIYERIHNDQSRPLLQNSMTVLKIQQMLKERQKFYESCSDIVINVEDKNVAEIASELLLKTEIVHSIKI